MSRTRLALVPLEARDNPTVLNYGGPVLTAVEAQPVYYGQGWAAAPAAETTTTAFLQDVTRSAYMDALTRAGYGVGRGSAAAGAADPVALTAGATVTDASIQARLAADVAAGRLPAPDANRLYVVFVQPDVAVDLGAGQGTTRQGVEGYHGAFAGPGGAAVRYAVVAYPGGAAGNTRSQPVAVDQLTAVASHELAEAVTDPDVNYGRLGWYDPRRGEIGDITENNPTAYVRLDGYLVQEVADQSDRLLSVAPPLPPPPAPSPPPTPSPAAPTTTSLTAGPVHYSGWFATATLTVTVRPATGAAQPGGTVHLVLNGQDHGAATLRLVNGVETASFTVVFLASGSYSFTAQYAGAAAFQGSTSPAATVVV